jgi:three-Cys-motif partner protein
MGSIEIFYNFMIVDANRNVLWHNPDQVKQSQKDKLTNAWGDESWRAAAYRTERGLFGDIEEKVTNDQVVSAFQKRLREVAGFKYVPNPLPLRNSNGATIYYLFFASPNRTGSKIVEDIFSKYR